LLLPYNFETTARRTFAIATLAHLHADYFGYEVFREAANFRMLSNRSGKRATFTTYVKPFVLPFNARRAAYRLQCIKCPADPVTNGRLWKMQTVSTVSPRRQTVKTVKELRALYHRAEARC
jgi:hypothetical protein